MSGFQKIFILLLAGFMVFSMEPVSAQFVTLARKIKAKRSEGKDIASVILEAGSSKVYKAVTDTLTADARCTILKRDDARKFVQFTHDAYSLTMRVDSLASGVSQITVEAENQKDPSQKPTDAAVKAVLAVCKKVGMKCTLKEVDTTGPK
jgi:hypothetical protein